MPHIPEEPQIPESAQGPRVTPAAGRTAPTPRPVPGPRSAATPRPGHPGPAPARPGPRPTPVPPAAARPAGRSKQPENRSSAQLQLIPASADGALAAADEAVDLLLDSGRTPGDILVLTTDEQHPWAVHELSFGEAAYWAQHDAGDDVFFAHVSKIDRCTSRSVVVVAVNGDVDDSATRALSVARERAGALLIVCGDPQKINSVFGAGV